MPLQNRVNPFGEVFATSARGAWMGNRGCLHEASRQSLSRRWTRKAWVTCCLEYDGIRRKLMVRGQASIKTIDDSMRAAVRTPRSICNALGAGYRPRVAGSIEFAGAA